MQVMTRWIVLICPECNRDGQDERWPLSEAEEADPESVAHLCPSCGAAGIPDTHWKEQAPAAA